MLEKVEIRTSTGVLLTLPLLGESNGYIVQDIQNLDPVKAEYVSTSYAQLDGEIKQATRRGKRNMVFILELDLDYLSTTVSERRNYLYQIFIPKTQLHLRFFETTGRQVDIYSEVESIISPRFSKDPTATISLLSFKPDFYIATPVVVSGSTVSNMTETPHQYLGTVDTGVLFEMQVNRALSSFVIYHRSRGDIMNSMSFETAEPLQAGDILKISTEQGNKYATLVRDGVDIPVLYMIAPQSDWIRFYPGENNIRVYTEGALIPYTFTYTTKIGGI